MDNGQLTIDNEQLTVAMQCRDDDQQEKSA